MSSARLARRAATVSSGALALCLFSAGVAAADTGLPPVPSPNNVVTTIDQTVKQTTTTVTSTVTSTVTQTGSTAPGSTTPGSTTPGSTTPTTTTPGSTTPTTTTPTTAKKPVVSTPKKPTVRHAAPARKPAAPSAAAASMSYAAMMPAPVAGDLALPPATGVSLAAGQSPAIAPLLMPQVKQPVSPAALAIEADKHTGPPIRAILLTLAIAAAVGVGYEHVRLVARGIPA